MTKTIIFLTILLIGIFKLNGQSVLENTDMKSYSGFFNYYYSEVDDKIYLEVIHLDSGFIYVSSLSEGVGSNDLELDRGQISGSRVVSFQKAGNKLLMIQPNLDYRAITSNDMEKKSVEEAFAKSVLFGFPIVEKTENGYLIDLTPFLLQDTHGVSERLQQMKQGGYNVDNSRSALNMERTRSFPKNVEFDVLLTFTGSPKRAEIASVTPDAKFVSVYQHHSFVELPDNNFKPRKYHPNCGGSPLSYMNYSVAIGEDMEVKYSMRHRLEKKLPNAAKSEAVEPIIYYLDNGTPEPVRSALMEGAAWWNEAFESIGFKNAFQIRVLPDTVDPMDLRYNVIQWVHRSTRGWSYGMSVIDPRTGEIIKGHVSLGSLRIRQDYSIAQALSKDPFKDGADDSDMMLEFALARIKQLSAHEVGHTLGFAHNFAASTNDRASVMDYPHPLVTINNNEIDLSYAYAKGIGEWDKICVAYAYSQFEDNEEDELYRIVNDAMKSGFRFSSDADARPRGSANAYGHLWDNGDNITEGLIDVIKVREKAILQFGTDNIKKGDSFDQLEDLFVLLYFYHRYQTEAAIKSIAGADYSHALKGEVNSPAEPLPSEDQRRALGIVLQTIDATFLAAPKEKLQLFPPRAYGQRTRESFSTMTGVTFDPFSAAATACANTLVILLNPERAARLVAQKALDRDQLGLDELLDNLIENSLMKSYEDDYLNNIQVTINGVVLVQLMNLARTAYTYDQVRDITNEKIADYLSHLKGLKKRNVYQNGQIRTIEAYFKHPEQTPMNISPPIPDGSPIGTGPCTHGF